MSETLWIGTANRGYAQQAQEELRRLFAPSAIRFTWLAPGETFTFSLDGEREDITSALVKEEPIFLRHVQPVDVKLEWHGKLQEAVHAAKEALERLRSVLGGLAVAVQARKPEGAAELPSPSELKRAVDPALESEFGAVPSVHDADWILSLYMTESAVYAGVSRPEQNLSDWPGGAVRFRKEDGQISRAKFKLLEAERTFGLDFTRYTNALDVGAAPGGWTSLLLERGLSVTAIDPAKLDPSLLKNPQLTYLAKKADQVKLAADSFDLFVCDMSWNPRQMSKLVRDLMYALQSGGTAVITVKLMHGKAFQTIREVVEDLSDELQLQKAKQLFHNREELTLFFIRK